MEKCKTEENAIRVFDLHCDTLTACLDTGCRLQKNSKQLDLTRMDGYDGWVQAFACWLQPQYHGPAAWKRFLAQREVLVEALRESPEQIERYDPEGWPAAGKCAAILTVEGGHALGGELSHIPQMRELGVQMLALLWNGENELGSGAVDGSPNGLKPFGKACIPLLEENRITVDISHLNDAGIDDVFALSTRPVAASHSNLREVCGHPRNLQDDHFQELCRRGGVCGINYYPLFVNGEKDYSPRELVAHLDRMLWLGGEDTVALGSDFDGASMPHFLKSVEMLANFYADVVKWYGEKLAKKLFFANAARFAAENFRLVGQKEL